MNQGRFDWRTLLGILVALGLGLALTLSTLSGVRGAYEVELVRELTDRAGLLAEALEGLEASAATDMLERAQRSDADLGLCWQRPDGEVLHLSSRVRGTHEPPQRLRPGIPTTRILDEPDGPWIQVLLPVSSGGWIGVSSPEVLAQERSNALHRRVLRLTIPIGVIGLGMGLLWVLRFKRSIREVTGFVADIDRRTSGRRLPSRGAGTIGDLSRAVNRMAWEVESHDQAVEREMAHRRAILVSMDDGVVAVDEDQRVLAINRTVLEQLGITVGEPEGLHLWEVTRQRDALELVERCLTQRQRLRRRVEVSSASGGRTLHLEMRVSPIVDAQGGGCVLVVGDRTEIEHLERVRRDFVANVSHELKTPLTSVHGYLETLREDDDLPPERRKRFLKKAFKNSDRLIAIVTDLLSLARAESVGASLEFAPVHLFELALEVRERAQTLAVESGILIDVTRGAGLERSEDLTVLGDKAALTLALGNLVENAIKYSGPGTRVVIRIEPRGTFARVTVIDQGPGIGREHHDRLFERFYRVDKERSRQLGGTGLGLSIVRNVVAVHGGRVGVESEVGEGSRFWMELPLGDLA